MASRERRDDSLADEADRRELRLVAAEIYVVSGVVGGGAGSFCAAI